MTALVALGVLLIVVLVGAVIAFTRLATPPFIRLVIVVVIIYVALAFVLELRAVMIERGQDDRQELSQGPSP